MQVLHSPSAGSCSAGPGHIWHLVPDGLRLTLPRAALQGDAPSKARAPVLHCTPEGSCRGPMMAEAQHLSIWPVFRASWCLQHHQEACRDRLVLCSIYCHCWQACMAAVQLVVLCLALSHGAVQGPWHRALSPAVVPERDLQCLRPGGSGSIPAPQFAQRSTALRLQLHLWGQQAIPTSLANVEAVAAKHKLSLGCEATTDRVPSTAAGQPAVLL